MWMNKKAYIHHPIAAIIIGFLLGMIVMWLMMKGYIPTNGIFSCVAKTTK